MYVTGFCWNSPSHSPLTASGRRLDCCVATATAISTPRRVMPICLPTAMIVAAIVICSASSAIPAKVPPPATSAGTPSRFPSGAGVPDPDAGTDS